MVIEATTREFLEEESGPRNHSSHLVAAPGMPLLRLHGCLHAFENHRILVSHQIVEGSLVERIFAEESEHPVCVDHLAAREPNVIPRQIVGLGDGGIDSSDELA